MFNRSEVEDFLSLRWNAAQNGRLAEAGKMECIRNSLELQLTHSHAQTNP